MLRFLFKSCLIGSQRISHACWRIACLTPNPCVPTAQFFPTPFRLRSIAQRNCRSGVTPDKLLSDIRAKIRNTKSRLASLVKSSMVKVYPEDLAVREVKCTLRIMVCVLGMMYIAFCMIPFAFCMMHFAFCMMHFAFCMMHFAFCTMHFAFCLMHFA